MEDQPTAADVTLRRKSSITGPNTTFDKTAEWDSYPSTCDGIGTHSLYFQILILMLI
jgi:hypothetical protein